MAKRQGIIRWLAFAGVTAMATVLGGRPAHALNPQPEPPGITFVVSAVSGGATFALHQESIARGQGVTVIHTESARCLPPGPCINGKCLPPGPCHPVIANVTAADEATASGVALAVAVARLSGFTCDQITNTFNRNDFGISVELPPGPCKALLPPTDQTAITRLIAAAVASDRPGGGCEAILAAYQVALDALGLNTLNSCIQPR